MNKEAKSTTRPLNGALLEKYMWEAIWRMNISEREKRILWADLSPIFYHLIMADRRLAQYEETGVHMFMERFHEDINVALERLAIYLEDKSGDWQQYLENLETMIGLYAAGKF